MKFKPTVMLHGSVLQPLKEGQKAHYCQNGIWRTTGKVMRVLEQNNEYVKFETERDMFLYLQSAVQTAKKYLAMCGNVVLEHKNETRFCVEVFYQLLNRDTSLKESLDERIKKVRNHYILENGKESEAKIPVTELVAPDTINFKSYKYVILDGVYHAYLYIPSGRYRSRVPAGWLSLLINAGEGIDIDLFFFRQDKNKSMERIGRRIRLNRSKIKDTYDSNRDFDSLSESIQAGYYLKRGLSGSEEFYYIYFCHELDMRHLCRVKQEIGWKQQGTIICLDYQANTLRESYLGRREWKP